MGDTAGPVSHLVCGYLGCDGRPFNPLLAALPRVIHVNGCAGGAIGTFVQFAIDEARERRPGGEAVHGHLSELMFVDVVRRYLETLPPDRTGWLAALREPFVGRALTALHRSPAHGWTLDAPGHEVGLSRSALAERFTQFVGQPPMQYLANWRMQLAATGYARGHRRSGRLRIRGGVQPRVQESGRNAAGRVAEPRPLGSTAAGPRAGRACSPCPSRRRRLSRHSTGESAPSRLRRATRADPTPCRFLRGRGRRSAGP